MAKTTLKGIIREIKPEETYGDKNQFRQQNIILFVPGFINQFGEKVGPNEEWELEAANQRIDALKVADLTVGEKVEIETWLAGVGYDRKDGSGRGYFIRARIGSIISHGKQEDNDLPF